MEPDKLNILSQNSCERLKFIRNRKNRIKKPHFFGVNTAEVNDYRRSPTFEKDLYMV